MKFINYISIQVNGIKDKMIPVKPYIKYLQ